MTDQERDLLPDWAQRLLIERDELQIRLQNLNRFCESDAFDALPEADQNDLATQRHHMQRYLLVLQRRLGRALRGTDDQITGD